MIDEAKTESFLFLALIALGLGTVIVEATVLFYLLFCAGGG